MDIFGLCLPLVDITAKLARDAYKTAEDARYTKKICLILADRLEIGSRALSDLYRHRDEKDKEEKFKSSNFYNSLQSYVNAATEIKRFIDEVSKLSGAMKYIKSSSHKGKVNQLVKRYDEAIADLKLGISLDEFKEIHDLQNTMETEFEKIDMKLMIDTLASMSNSHKQPIEIKSLEIKSIGQHDLRDPDPEQVVKRGKVFKKLLKGYEPVACKPFTDEEYKEEDFPWNQEPSLRPNMPTFLTQLATLYRNYYYSPHILPKPRVNSYSSSSIGKEITLLRDDDDLSLDTLTLDDAPKVGDPLKASEFMKYMEKAAFHENQVALYNMGDIYYEGKLNLPRNQKQAIIYYKKAALKGHEKSIKKLQSLNISIYGD
nr:6439_t:CDS:2 [Entrophospora candida]